MTLTSAANLQINKHRADKFAVAMNNNIKILLIDNSRIMRTGLSSILSNFHEVDKVVEISNNAKVISEMFLSDYEIIIVDIENNVDTNTEMISGLRIKVPSSTIIVFTYARNLKLKDDCIARGADFFFLKSDEYEKLTYTVRRIAEGNLIWRN